jgi:hypothetical protein
MSDRNEIKVVVDRGLPNALCYICRVRGARRANLKSGRRGFPLTHKVPEKNLAEPLDQSLFLPKSFQKRLRKKVGPNGI